MCHKSSKTILEVLSPSPSPLGKGSLCICGYSGKAYGFLFSLKGVEMSSKPSIEKKGQKTTSGKKMQLGGWYAFSLSKGEDTKLWIYGTLSPGHSLSFTRIFLAREIIEASKVIPVHPHWVGGRGMWILNVLFGSFSGCFFLSCGEEGPSTVWSYLFFPLNWLQDLSTISAQATC